ncbi:MAG: ribosome maturation factor RimM [Gomphosphaeria aponina SAG 52.96 = DSM 107014]|uniref:Ribosome maturation factor RimM n=1 Tax=Gomphosphaeria aponina SAG 52.96 = DSM 107014 TaxID=1521640 RepID=A0A941GQ29_9CHRO|nr:ribosome maturation factor RimM [Gomphosphaeria aponina SAG 52.96 = DSM 107014]
MNHQASTINNEWLEIGTIVSPKGLKGELRINPSTDFPARFEEPGKRWLQRKENLQPEPVELLRGYQIPGKNIYVVQLAEVKDRTQAETLLGCRLLVNKSDRPQLEEDEYHVADLINLAVYHQITGENIGTVTEIFWAGNDILEVTLHQQPVMAEKNTPDLSNISRKTKRKKYKPKAQKPATVLIPFVKEIVPIVDLEKQRLEITPPPGLLDLK